MKMFQKIKKKIKSVWVKRELLKGKRKIRVGFVLQVPALWDKLNAVYESLERAPSFEVIPIVIPPYNWQMEKFDELCEDNLFIRLFPNCVYALQDDGNVIDISTLCLDYIFYQRPYDVYMPSGLKSCDVANYAKVCYVPYGYSMLKKYSDFNTNDEFFRNVYFAFLDCKENLEILSKQYSLSIQQGKQHFVLTDYPEFDNYRRTEPLENAHQKPFRILWTPRWTYDSILGGSHFFEYKDPLVEFANRNPSLQITIRPHPMMFENFLKEGRMSKEDFTGFKNKLQENGIILSETAELKDDLLNADILITDYSTIIAPYLLTGNPIIYCDELDDEPFNHTEMLFDSLYRCTNWNAIEERLCSLLNGEDERKPLRMEAAKTLGNGNAAQGIRDMLFEDYIARASVE